MTYDEHDALMDAGWESMSEEMYEDHFYQAVEDFTYDRLISYYKDNPELMRRINNRIEEAQNLLSVNPSASFIFSVSAIELCIKNAIVRPLVHGFIHNESAAELIVKMVFEIRVFLKFQEFTLNLLKNCLELDLHAAKKEDSSEILWKEIENAQIKRNLVLHRGEYVQLDEAKNVLLIVEYLVIDVFSLILKKIGLGLNKDGIIGNIHSEKGVIIDTPTRLKRLREKKSYESLLSRIVSLLYRLDSKSNVMKNLPRGTSYKEYFACLKNEYPDVFDVDLDLIFDFKERIKMDKYTWSEDDYINATREADRLIEGIAKIFPS